MDLKKCTKDMALIGKNNAKNAAGKDSLKEIIYIVWPDSSEDCRFLKREGYTEIQTYWGDKIYLTNEYEVKYTVKPAIDKATTWKSREPMTIKEAKEKLDHIIGSESFSDIGFEIVLYKNI